MNTRYPFSILFIILCIAFLNAKAQCNWQPLGADDYATAYYDAIGDEISMAIDANGSPYFVGWLGTVRKFNGTGWETVGASNLAPAGLQSPCLAINKTGSMYFAFQDFSKKGKAEVLKFNGTSWAPVSSQPASPGSAYYVSLAFNSGGLPCLAYSDSLHGGKASVVQFNGSTWMNIGQTGFSKGRANYTSIAFDPAGNPWVAFSDSTSGGGNVSVMKFTGSTWVYVGQQGFSLNVGLRPHLAIDLAGQAYVAYNDAAQGLTLMKFNGSAWIQLGAGFPADFMTTFGFCLDKNGTPYVAFSDVGKKDLVTVFEYTGNTWSNVGPATFTKLKSAANAIAVDPNGNPWIIYSDGSYSSKPYALKYDGVAWQTEGPTGLDVAAEYASPSLAIDANNVPYLAVSNSLNKSKGSVIKYQGSSWVNVGLPGFTPGGVSMNLKLDKNNIPYVAFADSASGYQVSVMNYTGNAWNYVGQAHFLPHVNNSPPLALDAAGKPYILALNGAGNTLTVMSFDGTAWNNVGNPGFVTPYQYGYQSLALDSAGVPYVAFQDNVSPFPISVMKFNGVSWVYLGGNVSDSVGRYPTITFSPTGAPYVSFMDTGGRATVKTFDGTNWNTIGPRCFSSSAASWLTLSLDQNGNPFVAYEDLHYSISHIMAFNNQSWVNIGMNISPGRFENPSLAFDHSGIPYVAYTNTEAFVRQYSCLGAGVTELTQPANRMSIYPNPSEEQFTVETSLVFPAEEHAELLVCTLTSQLILQVKTTGTKTTLDLSSQPNGMYIVRLQNKSGVCSYSKIIKRK
jgi:hypothetical protein